MLKDKVIEIFVPADDFCKEFSSCIQQFRLESGETKHRNRHASLSDSEIISILIFSLWIIYQLQTLLQQLCKGSFM